MPKGLCYSLLFNTREKEKKGEEVGTEGILSPGLPAIPGSFFALWATAAAAIFQFLVLALDTPLLESPPLASWKVQSNSLLLPRAINSCPSYLRNL